MVVFSVPCNREFLLRLAVSVLALLEFWVECLGQTPRQVAAHHRLPYRDNHIDIKLNLELSICLSS